MKITKENLQLSGKGTTLSEEFLHENIKIITSETQLHEVVVVEDDTSRRVGWLVPNQFDLLADFNIHTDNGMKGKSTEDKVSQSLIIDPSGLLEQLLPETLDDVDTTESQEILDKMIREDKNFQGKITLDDLEEKDDGLIILSPRSNLVFVQTDDSSIRVSSDDGVYVLKRGDEKEKLIMIDKDHGVNIWGDKSVNIGPEGMFIDGKLFNPQKIVEKAMRSVAPTLASLGALGSLGGIGSAFGNAFESSFDDFDVHFEGEFEGMHDFDKNMKKFEKKMEKFGKKMEKMGEKLSKSFAKNFEKNFSMNFGSDFDDDFDTDFSDAHDVDVDY